MPFHTSAVAGRVSAIRRTASAVVIAMTVVTVIIGGFDGFMPGRTPSASAIDFDPCDLLGCPVQGGDTLEWITAYDSKSDVYGVPTAMWAESYLYLVAYTNVSSVAPSVSFSGDCERLTDDVVSQGHIYMEIRIKAGLCNFSFTATKNGVTVTRAESVIGYRLPAYVKWVDGLAYPSGYFAVGEQTTLTVETNSAYPVAISAVGACSITDSHVFFGGSTEFTLMFGPGTGTCSVTAFSVESAQWLAATPITREFRVYDASSLYFWQPGARPPAVMTYPAAIPAVVGIVNNAGGGDTDFFASGACTATRDPSGSLRWNIITVASGDCVLHAQVLAFLVRADGTFYQPMLDAAIPVVAVNRPPVASFSVDNTNPAAPAVVHVDGNGSSDPDGDPLTYQWNFGDGHGSVGATAATTYYTAATRTISLTVTDSHGAVSTATSDVVVTDVSAPVVTPTVAGTLGSNGWYTSDVAVTWVVNDLESPVLGATGCGASILTVDNSGTTFTCSATSSGGTTSQSVTLARDATPPTLAPTVDPAVVPIGSEASAAANAADAMSGVASAGCDAPVTSTLGAASVECTATDLAGNEASAAAGYSVIDASPPTVTPVVTGTLGTNGWYTSDVSLTWIVADPESAIVASTGCDPILITEDTVASTFTCSPTSAGGTTSESVLVKRDTTAPTLAPVVVPNPVTVGTAATASANATDATSGVAAAACAAPSTGSIGVKTVDCRATDQAGNTATGTVTYAVTYAWDGPRGDVEASPVVNRMHAGKAVGVSFDLGGWFSLGVFANGSPSSRAVTCPAGAVLHDVAPTSNTSTSGLSFNSRMGFYTYTWATDKKWKNTCRELSLVLSDGTVHTVVFQFA